MVSKSQQDEKLYQELLRNVENGVELLLRIYGPEWHGYLRKAYCPTLQDVDFEEIISAAIWKICKAISSFDKQRGKFRTWTFAIMSNTARDYLRSVRKHKPFVHLKLEDWGNIPAPEERCDDTDISAFLSSKKAEIFDRAFAELPLLQQRVLRIYSEHEGVSAREVGEILGITAGNARQLKKRAFNKLETVLKVIKQTTQK